MQGRPVQNRPFDVLLDDAMDDAMDAAYTMVDDANSVGAEVLCWHPVYIYIAS